MTSLIPLAQYRMHEDHMDSGWHWEMMLLAAVVLIASALLRGNVSA